MLFHALPRTTTLPWLKKTGSERGRVLIFPVAVEARPIGLAEINFNAARMQKGYGRMKRGREWIHPWIRRYILPSARFIKEWKQCFRPAYVCARDGRSNVDRKSRRKRRETSFLLFLDIYISLSFSLLKVGTDRERVIWFIILVRDSDGR